MNTKGFLILNALESLNEPVTSETIISKIAQFIELPQQDVKDCVMEALNNGVRFGYVQKIKEKYTILPVETGDDKKTRSDDSSSEDGSMSDGARRRRSRNKRRRGKKSGSRRHNTRRRSRRRH